MRFAVSIKAGFFIALAPFSQTLTQAPHNTHFSISVMLLSRLQIAPVGQTATHLRQLPHRSLSVSGANEGDGFLSI